MENILNIVQIILYFTVGWVIGSIGNSISEIGKYYKDKREKLFHKKVCDVCFKTIEKLYEDSN